MIGPPVLRRRILKGSGQPDRERAAVLMEGGGNAFMSYMNFGDEQDRSSFPTDDLAAQCAFVLGHLPGCDTKHITAPQQPTLGRSAKGAHGPVGWQLAAAPLGCAPERRRGLRAEARGDA